MWVRKLNKGIVQQVVVGLPMIFMTIMTLWALVLNINTWISAIINGTRTYTDPIGILSVALVVLALSLIYLSVKENLKFKTAV
jgi:carbon starvation protein CstA